MPFGLTRGAGAAIATIVSVGIAVSLMTPLVSLTLYARGISERQIGLVFLVYASAALFATPVTTRIAARLGTANTIATATMIAALLMPLAWYISDVDWLLPVMFVFGACLSVCFTLSEYWITSATPENRRGVIVGIYATLLSVGFAIGPAIIVLLGTDPDAGIGDRAPHRAAFLLGSGLLMLAAVPALLARDVSPDFREVPKMRFTSFLFAVPIATLGAFVFSMGESSGFAFLPLWGGHLGFAASTSALLVSAMTLGNVVFQIPLGMLADRMDRRLIVLACAIVGAGGMAVAWHVSASPLLVSAVLFIWGGATAGIYTVGLAHLASRFSGASLAGANAAFVFCYALGMLVGPMAVGDAMERAPVAGLPLVLGSAFAVYFFIVAGRTIRNSAPAVRPRRRRATSA
jgi:MFS family permease